MAGVCPVRRSADRFSARILGRVLLGNDPAARRRRPRRHCFSAASINPRCGRSTLSRELRAMGYRWRPPDSARLTLLSLAAADRKALAKRLRRFSLCIQTRKKLASFTMISSGVGGFLGAGPSPIRHGYENSKPSFPQFTNLAPKASDAGI
jgi:hypothetical protein